MNIYVVTLTYASHTWCCGNLPFVVPPVKFPRSLFQFCMFRFYRRHHERGSRCILAESVVNILISFRLFLLLRAFTRLFTVYFFIEFMSAHASVYVFSWPSRDEAMERLSRLRTWERSAKR